MQHKDRLENSKLCYITSTGTDSKRNAVVSCLAKCLCVFMCVHTFFFFFTIIQHLKAVVRASLQKGNTIFFFLLKQSKAQVMSGYTTLSPMEHYYCNVWGKCVGFVLFFFRSKELYIKWSLVFPLHVTHICIRIHIGEQTNDKVHTWFVIQMYARLHAIMSERPFFMHISCTCIIFIFNVKVKAITIKSWKFAFFSFLFTI